MNITRCPNPNTNTCSPPSTTQCNTNSRSVCYMASIPVAQLPFVIDIHWTGETTTSLVRNLLRPNSHSFILGTDALPEGYFFDTVTNILYFPSSTPVTTTQFAVWTPPSVIDSCGTWTWTAVAICVGVESVFCDEINIWTLSTTLGDGSGSVTNGHPDSAIYGDTFTFVGTNSGNNIYAVCSVVRPQNDSSAAVWQIGPPSIVSPGYAPSANSVPTCPTTTCCPQTTSCCSSNERPIIRRSHENYVITGTTPTVIPSGCISISIMKQSADGIVNISGDNATLFPLELENESFADGVNEESSILSSYTITGTTVTTRYKIHTIR